MENVIYDVKDCAEALADEDFRRECIDLYSGHYGIWGIRPVQNLRAGMSNYRIGCL